MVEYVDRSKVLKILKRYSTENGSALGLHSGAVDCVMEEICMIDIMDVEPVVRCKDCKWDRPDFLLNKHWCTNFLGCFEVLGDDFCSRGKRKDEVDNGIMDSGE